MKATIYKSKDHSVGWFWKIESNHWQVMDYAITKRGAIAAAKRYMRKQKKVMPSFEVEIDD